MTLYSGIVDFISFFSSSVDNLVGISKMSPTLAMKCCSIFGSYPFSSSALLLTVLFASSELLHIIFVRRKPTLLNSFMPLKFSFSNNPAMAIALIAFSSFSIILVLN